MQIIAFCYAIWSSLVKEHQVWRQVSSSYYHVPPIRRLSTLQRYNTVDDLQNPTKFAVFQDNSILIRHLVKFQKRALPQLGIFKLLS